MQTNRYLLIIICVCALLTGCSSKTAQTTAGFERHSAEFLELFDTHTQIIAYTKSLEEFETQVNDIYEELKEYHELFDIYHSYDGINNMKTINDNAGIQPVKVDQRIIDLLLLGKDLYEDTDGEVNLAFGSVLRIWHEYREDGINSPLSASLPNMEELKAALPYTKYEDVIIDQTESTVFLREKEMSLDVGAIAKGYAVQKVCEHAEERGLLYALVSVGGNVKSIGEKPGQGNWKVGLQNPDTESKETFLHKLLLKEQSLVTSGDYQRYYTVDGKRYHHIIDPKTLMPAAYFKAVSILCPDSGRADALSTAVFNMDFESGKAFVEELPDVEAVWVHLDGSLSYSSGYEKYIVK